MAFVKILPKEYLFAFEMRNPSWYVQDFFELFKKFNIALCIHDFTGELLVEQITANLIYLRFHGPVGLYYGKCSSDHLFQWAEKINIWQEQSIRTFAYFNNDAHDWAINNALEIKNYIT